MLPYWTRKASLYNRPRPSAVTRRLQLENLEGRELLATFNWIAASDGNFAVASNWLNTTTNAPGVPGSNDTAAIPNGVEVTSNASRTINSLSGGSLRVSAGTFTVTNTGVDSLVVGLTVDAGTTFRTSAGTTAVIGSEISGTIDTFAGATFRFIRGANNLNAGVALIGAGTYTLLGDVFGGPVVDVKTNVTAPANVLFANGSIIGAGNLTIGQNFQWQTGLMSGTGQTIVTPTGILSLSLGGMSLDARTINNSGTILYAATTGQLTMQNNATINNLNGGVINIQSEQSIGGAAAGVINNAGLIRRSSGVGISQLRTVLNNSGTIEVQTGTLSFFLGTGTAGTYRTSAGATLDLTSNGSFHLGGTSSFVGNGTVLTGGGVLSTTLANTIWSIPNTVAFVWTSNTIIVPVGASVSVNGNVTFAGSSNTQLRGGGKFRMNGTLNHTGTGDIQVSGDLSSNSVATTIEIPAGRQYIVRSTGGITGGDLGIVANFGTISKLTNGGTAFIAVRIDNSANITVSKGILLLHKTNHLSGTYSVAAGSSLQLLSNGGSQFVVNGSLALAGTGTVEISNGQLKSGATGAAISFPATVTLNWAGGNIFVPAAATLAINGDLRIAGTDTLVASGGGTLLLNGNTALLSTGNLRLDGDGLNTATTVRVPAGKSLLFSSDAGISGGSGGGGVIDNVGLLRKTAGVATSVVAAQLLKPANLQVDTGVLQLSINGGTVLGGNVVVANNAVLDLIGGNFSTTFSGTFTGAGAGQVQLNRGGLVAAASGVGATFNFPAGLFRILGGTINTNASTVTLQGETTFLGANDLTLLGSGILRIVDVFNHTSTRNINIIAGTTLNIATTGTFNFLRDANVVGDTFDNQGIIKKTGGTGISVIGSHLTNGGTVEVRVGTLSITGTIAEVAAGTLTGGKWNVLASSTNTATLNFNSVISSIGLAATVNISGATSSVPSLSTLASVFGTIQLTSGAQFNTSVNLTNSGRIVVGAGSQFTVNGNYTQVAAGRLSLQMTNSTIGKLVASGNVALGGNLSITFAGILPAIGTSLTLLENLSASSIAGTFAGLPANTTISFGGMNWTIRYNQGPGGNDVTLVRVS